MIEIWKEIKDYPDYKISSFGRVKSLRYDKILKPRPNNKGYLRVNLYKNKKLKTINIHRLVTTAFISNPENKPQVNHISGIKSNNYVENLEWCTNSENHFHAHKIGLMNHKGEKHSQSKLTEKEVYQIRDLIKDKYYNQTEISKIFNVTRMTISNIKRRVRWKHI